MNTEKIAVVTGGTKGIGRRIVLDLLARNYRVWTSYASDDAAAERAREEFSAAGECVVIREEDEWGGGIVRAVKSRERAVHCVVGNAGTTLRKAFPQITNEEWSRVMNVNLNANFALVRDLFPLIAPDSRIVFIGSLLGVHPHGTSLPYGVSKAALHALAKNLVKVFAGTGTTVNAIAPGFTETEWQKTKPEEIRRSICGKTAQGRFADPREISAAVLFCIDNAFLNGEILQLSGGYSFK